MQQNDNGTSDDAQRLEGLADRPLAKEEAPGAPRHNFGTRMKLERTKVGMTQAQLATRLEDEFDIRLDTSGITRIEAGRREPRLSEALAIAEILGMELSASRPAPSDLNPYMQNVIERMHESRERLLGVLEAVDEVSRVAQQNPGCLEGGMLSDVFAEELTWFGYEAEGSPRVNRAKDISDFELKRKILISVSDGILLGPDRTPSRADSARWEDMFKQLRRFSDEHGHARVPKLYVQEGHSLGRWVASLRNQYFHGLLDADLKRQLEELPGWTWSRGPRHGESALVKFAQADFIIIDPADGTVRVGESGGVRNQRSEAERAEVRRRADAILGTEPDDQVPSSRPASGNSGDSAV